jgi:hypothetical protein
MTMVLVSFRGMRRASGAMNPESLCAQSLDSGFVSGFALTPGMTMVLVSFRGMRRVSGAMNPESMCVQSLDSGFLSGFALTPRNDGPGGRRPHFTSRSQTAIGMA